MGASGWYNDSATTMAGAGRPSSSDSRGRRYDIRTDVYYDAANMVLMAALELPGVKKDNLKIELATCLISRIRQVTVTAIVRPEFPFAVKPQEQLGSPLAMTSEVSAPRLLISQRRYGIYKRSYGVASHVQVRPSLLFLLYTSFGAGICSICLLLFFSFLARRPGSKTRGWDFASHHTVPQTLRRRQTPDRRHILMKLATPMTFTHQHPRQQPIAICIPHYL